MYGPLDANVTCYKDDLLNRIEHEYICCDTDHVINRRF